MAKRKLKKMVVKKKTRMVSLRLPEVDYEFLVDQAILDGDDEDDERNVSKQIRKAIRKYRVAVMRNETV